ncbi:uncharacterized protein [Cicer arietinum]|uniref:uncharacterized protein isoform X1 n=2 Tax=Cicer arietinum TaxID=3827 RepID=UPI003CC5033E
MKEAMARRRKLNIRHRASDNEGIQSTSNNTNSTNVEGSNVAETRSSPCHAEGVIRESVESHSIPSDIEVEEEQIEKEVEPKRARGPTKMLDVWEMEDGDLIIVNLDKYGRPIGEEGTTLTRFIGSVARRYQYAPINYKSWKVMPNDYKEEMLKLIESKFEFVPPINDLTREMLKSELNEKWRQWKGDLKSMAYDPTKTEEEVASLVPDDRVDPNQYRGLVHHWFSDEGQKISKINRQNRAKFEDVHCMGSKSLPKFIDEKIKKGKGVLPGRKEIYIDTCTRKDGTIVNEKAARLIEELKKHNNEAGTSQSTQDTQGSMSWKDDIFYQVQGPDKNRRVRCMGKIPHSKKSKVCASENEELRERVKNMENLLANVMTLIQNRFSGADVNDIIQAARQVPDATSAQNHLNSLSPNNNENNENGN